MNVRPGIIAALVGLSLLAGCSEESGTPVGSSAGTPSSAQSDDSSPQSSSVPGAPKVANPIENLEHFKKSPCDMLTDEQVSSLGFSRETPEPDGREAWGCHWENPEKLESFGIGLLKKQPLGIAGIYRNNRQFDSMYKYFEPIEISGYPGVFSDSYDGRASGACTLSVGVTDSQVFTITTQVETDACEFAKRVAGAAIESMRSG